MTTVANAAIVIKLYQYMFVINPGVLTCSIRSLLSFGVLADKIHKLRKIVLGYAFILVKPRD